MSPLADRDEPGDPRFVDWVEALDEALAAGRDASALAAEPPAELRDRLSAAEACLRRLDEHWHSRSSQRPDVTLDGTGDATPPEGVATLGLGSLERIGRFEIARELGRGGCGIVFLAFDPWLGREVALKVPRPEALVASKLRRRFLREAQAAAGLDHPNVVRVYEAGEDGPICYLTTEYCPGPSLADWIESQTEPVPPRIAAGLVASLADGVDHAHQRGILHRDVKPSNVLLDTHLAPVPAGVSLGKGLPSLVPKLTDFGLAKLLEAGDDDTRTGSPLGTPAYMAPEQAQGRLDAICEATDAYGLGVILYELLTGRPPLRGATDVETLQLVSTDEPLPPGEFQPQLHQDLQAICLKALEKRPGDRYLSAAALATDLRRYLGGLPTEARPLGRLPRLARWARKRPLHVALMAVSLVAAALLSLGAAWHHFEIRSALVEAQRLRAEAESRAQQVRQYVYPGDVQLAYQAWKEGNAGRARQFLARHLPLDRESDLRDFAWHYVWGLCHSEELSLQGHPSQVFAAAFSRTADQVVTGGSDGRLRWWNLADGHQVLQFRAHENDINVVEFSPDGRWLVTASDDGYVKLFDAQSRSLIRTVERFNGRVLCVSFSPDAPYLAVSGSRGPVHLWNTETWTLQGELSPWEEGELIVDFGPDRLLATGDEGGQVLLWDTRTRQLVRRLADWGSTVVAVKFSPDGRQLATAGSSREIQIWDLTGGGLRHVLRGHRDRVESLDFSPDGRRLVSASKDMTARIWNLETGECERSLRGHGDRVWTVAFSPDGQRLLSTSSDRTCKIWNLDTNLEFTRLHEFPSARNLAVHPSGNWLALAGQSRIVFWEPGGTGGTWEFMPHADQSIGVTFSPNGQLLVTTSRDSTAKVLELENFERRLPPLVHPAGVLCASISSSGDRLATGCQDGLAYVWDLESGQLVTAVRCHWAPITCVQFLPVSDELITADERGEVMVTKLDTGAIRFELGRHARGITGLALTPDARRLATSSHDGTVKIWNLDNGVELKTLVGHRGSVQAVAISPGGELLASGGDDRTIRFWSLATGQEQLALAGHDGAVLSLAFLNDGQTLASAGSLEGGRGEVLLWHAPRQRGAGSVEGP